MNIVDNRQLCLGRVIVDSSCLLHSWGRSRCGWRCCWGRSSWRHSASPKSALMTGSGITCWWSYGVWKMGRTSSTWPPCPWIIICTKYGRLGEKNKNRKCQLFEKLQFFILFIFFIQKSVEIGNDLPGLKLKTLHVGGLPGEGNHVRKGFVGCIQVSVCLLTVRLVRWFFFFLSFATFNTRVLSIRACVWERRPTT